MEDALRAHTAHAAWQIGRDKDLGSITAGKLADLVELSSDPLAADPAKLTEQVKVVSTWRAGSKIDLDAFLKGVEAMDPTEHQHLAHEAAGHHCCAHNPAGHKH
ncbi:MAG: amidohydrolase family protein [Actinobacteria bacterium]|nr:amidohydrolase family protein [Actinomycetota bacterium]